MASAAIAISTASDKDQVVRTKGGILGTLTLTRYARRLAMYFAFRLRASASGNFTSIDGVDYHCNINWLMRNPSTLLQDKATFGTRSRTFLNIFVSDDCATNHA